MRKKLIGEVASPTPSSEPGDWLELREIASIEVSSEEAAFPAESVFTNGTTGWRSSTAGEQTLRLVFDEPRSIHRIELSFDEPERERTQELSLGWSGPHSPMTEIVRQQWTFSPSGSTREVEDYKVSLNDVQVLELRVRANISSDAYATLSSWRVA